MNTGGDNESDIYSHHLQVFAKKCIEYSDKWYGVAVGVKNVSNSPFDFQREKILSESFLTATDELKRTNGLDMSFCISSAESDSNLKLAAILTHKNSGRKLEIFTTQPILHAYSSGFMQDEDEIIGK